MKNLNLKLFGQQIGNGTGLIGLLMIVFLSSCSPTIHYLGDSFTETTQIDVYYDEKDVGRAYRTIGKMTHENMFSYEADTIKEKMIQSAKEKGGDGIIFLEASMSREVDFDGDRLMITANVIKYKE